jgi:hypothetical protein
MQNLVTWATKSLEFVHPCAKIVGAAAASSVTSATRTDSQLCVTEVNVCSMMAM